jgi:rod shape-determining protein MreC
VALSRRTGRSRLTLLLLVLTSITVLTLDFRGAGFVDDMRSRAADVFSPVRDAVSGVFEPVHETWNGIFDYDDVRAENEELRARIEELEGQVVAGADALERIGEIEAAAGLPTTAALPNLLARVVSGPLSNFDHTIEINRGAQHGVKDGMPVVTGAGLIGRVVQVSESRSVVRLITDPEFEVGVRHVATGEVGIARGNGGGEDLTVRDIAQEIEIAVGDPMTTSGIDRSIFPPDVPVGVVSAVGSAADELSQELALTPLADIDDLSYVTVLLWEPTP